jgi:hypothetical protein
MCATSTQWARQHLARQLGFLVRSCQAFDTGYVDEAIRMATVLRVLMYDTRASTSVLTHLNAKDTVRLLGTCPELRSLMPGAPADFDLAKFDECDQNPWGAVGVGIGRAPGVESHRPWGDYW